MYHISLANKATTVCTHKIINAAKHLHNEDYKNDLLNASDEIELQEF